VSVLERQNLLPALRHGGMILVVSVLIWLFAESQSVSERVVDVRLSFSAPSEAGLLVKVDDANWTGLVSVRLQGARAAIDEAARQLADGVPLLVGAPGVSAQPGTQLVELRSALLANPPMDRADVTIASVEPRAIELRIDELVTLKGVAVRANLTGVQTADKVEIDPPQVNVILPARNRENLGAVASSLTVVASLSQAVLSAIPEGGPQSHVARLSLPPELAGVAGVRVEPSSVTLTFTVRSTTESVTLSSVPVWPMEPPTEINNWDVVIEPMVLRDITLTGPSDLLQRITDGDLRVIAALRLSSDELEQRITSKAPVILGLPDSVRVETTIPPVRLTITPRAAPTPAQTPDQEE